MWVVTVKLWYVRFEKMCSQSTELIVHILSRMCDYVEGGGGKRGAVNRRAVALATAKNTGEKSIMIGRECGFYGVDNSVSSLGNDGNRGSVLGSR